MSKKLKLMTWAKKHKPVLILAAIYLGGVIAYAILIHLSVRILGSDDTIFIGQVRKYHSVFGWLNLRYNVWSGRLFSDGIVYFYAQASIHYWKLTAIFMYMLFTAIWFLYWKIFSRRGITTKDYFMMGLAVLLPFVMDPDVFFNGMLWMTGTMYYGWIVTIALFALFPIFYLITQSKSLHWIFNIISVILGIIVAFSQEQVSLVVFGLALILTIYRIIMLYRTGQKKLPIYPILFCIIIGVAILISLKAPGNTIRLQEETKAWIPDFYTTPFINHLDFGYRWVMDSFLNHTGFLLIGSWVLMLGLFIKKQVKSKLDYALMFMLLLAIILVLTKGYNASTYWYQFYPYWKPPQLKNWTEWIVYLPATFTLVTTIWAPFVLYRKQLKGAFLGLLYLASLGSIVMITFSPTMYASGDRSLYVASILLAFISFILFNDIFEKYRKYQKFIIWLVIAGAASQYLILFSRLLHLY